MRIATYTRISTDEEHQPYSLEAQAIRLDSYAKSQEDWRIVRRFTDQASGAILERPGLERALREAEASRFDLLLVYRVDRLSRSVRGLAQILERLDAAKVLFRSATEPFDTASSAGRISSPVARRRARVVARKNPERTKKTSTATKAPRSAGTPAWKPTTRSTARPRRPSRSRRLLVFTGAGSVKVDGSTAYAGKDPGVSPVRDSRLVRRAVRGMSGFPTGVVLHPMPIVPWI